jgi:uncharacterized protein (DUF2147 family)
MLIKMIALGCLSMLTVMASARDISGLWKTIDEQTGYSRADVLITKNADNTYSGKIIAIRPLPFKPLVETCTKCKGALKNAPYVGLQIVSGFKQNLDKPLEYENGKVLDPLSGNLYKGKAKMSENGKRLSMRGYVGISALGRSTTWIRAEE